MEQLAVLARIDRGSDKVDGFAFAPRRRRNRIAFDWVFERRSKRACSLGGALKLAFVMVYRGRSLSRQSPHNDRQIPTKRARSSDARFGIATLSDYLAKGFKGAVMPQSSKARFCSSAGHRLEYATALVAPLEQLGFVWQSRERTSQSTSALPRDKSAADPVRRPVSIIHYFRVEIDRLALFRRVTPRNRFL